MSAPPRARELLLAALVAAALGAVVFAGPLFGGRCVLAFPVDDPRIDMRPWARPARGPLPRINPIAPDTDGFVLPGMLRLRQLAALGGEAQWDESQMLGYPIAANLVYPVWSPVCALAWPLPPITALDLLLWFHTALAGALAYRLCRTLGAGPGPAAAGAVAFALSGFLVARWHSLWEVFVVGWWPAQATGVLALRRGRTVAGLAETAGATALMSVSGFPQHAAVLTATSVLLAALLPSRRPAEGATPAGRSPGRTLADSVRGAWPGAAACALGLALAAPAWWSSGSAYAQSLRSTPAARAAASAQGLPPAALVGLLLPEFFGRPSDFAGPDPPAPTMEAWLPQRLLLEDGPRSSVLYDAMYPGMLVLLLLVGAARAGAGTTPRRLLLVGAGAVVLALLGPWLAAHLPGARLLAAGTVKRLLVVPAACWPVAAALALQALRDGRVPVPRRAAGVLIVLLALAPLAATRIPDAQAPDFARALGTQAARQAAFVLLGALALGWSVRVQQAAARATAGTARTTARAARPGAGPGAGVRRLAAAAPAALLLADLGSLALLLNPFPPQAPPLPRTPALAALDRREGRVAVFGGGPNLLPPSAAAVHGIRSLTGIAPMVPARAAELLACIEGPLWDLADPRVPRALRDPAGLAHPLLDLLSVDTVVHAERGLAARTGLPAIFESEEEGLAALARPGAGPRAFVCGGARVVPDAGARLRWLAGRDAPVHATVLLERAPARALPESGPMRPVPVERPAGGRYELVSEAAFDGILVLAEAWAPGWSVEVDGAPAELHVADHALLAVELPAGRHAVRFRYAPPGRTAARATALAAAALLLAWGVGARRRGAGPSGRGVRPVSSEP
jgi:hypothetical protein